MKVLVVAEHFRGAVRPVTHELITAGANLGSVTVLVIASDPLALADEVNRNGVEEILAVTSETDTFEPDAYRSACEAVFRARSPDVILQGFTVDSIAYGAALAVQLGAGFASDVHGLQLESGRVIATRSFFGSKVDAELEFEEDTPVVLMLRPTTWTPATEPGDARVTGFAVPKGRSRTRHVAFIEPEQTDGVSVGAADLLLAVGRGLGDATSLPQFEELAAKMGATLAASRPIVDAGWVARSRLIGQSGSVVKPKVYLAFGISGAVQHLAGMKSAETIIAVNSDPDAAIFRVAHFGAVADMFEVADELARLYEP